jgi:hypothetical protein
VAGRPLVVCRRALSVAQRDAAEIRNPRRKREGIGEKTKPFSVQMEEGKEWFHLSTVSSVSNFPPFVI